MATSSNFGNVFSILGRFLSGTLSWKLTLRLKKLVASAWLPYEPIQPLQLLFQNLLYDFSQASIPWLVLLSFYHSDRLTDVSKKGTMWILSILPYLRLGRPGRLRVS